MGYTRKQIAILAVLVFGTFLGALNQTIVTPAMHFIMVEMDEDAAAVQWLTTGFTLVNAIMIPIVAYLSDRYSTRILFLVSMGIFTVGTLLVACGRMFWVLLAGRLVQAVGAGVLMPLVMIVIMLNVPVNRRGISMGLYGFVIGGGPALGPTVAGLIIGLVSWRIMFLIIAALSLAAIVAALFILDRGAPRRGDITLDRPSVLLSTAGFGALLYGCSVIGSYGVDPIDCLIAVFGVVAIVFFFRRQMHLPSPMLDVSVLANRSFRIGTILAMIVQISLLIGGVLVPLYVQSLRGLSATTLGLIILPGALIMGVMGPLAGVYLDRRGPRTLALVGMTLIMADTLAFALLGDTTGIAYLTVAYAVRLFAISLVNMPLTTWALNALPDELVNHGISVNNVFRQAAGSLGTAVLVSVMTAMASAAAPEQGAVRAGVIGIDGAFVVAGVVCAVGVVLAVLFVRGDGTAGV